MSLMNPNLKNFWFENGEWTQKRYKILHGGRSSSKSHDACGTLIYLTSRYKLKVLCTRMFQNKIADSVYTLLKRKIIDFGLESIYTITNNKIMCDKTGSEFLFYGIARNVDEIKSLEAVNICYLEEAQSITKEQWDIIIPTIRENRSEIWCVFNPQLVTDFIYNKFIVNKVPNAIVRGINYDENPFLTDTMSEEIETSKRMADEEDFNHMYLGYPKQDDNDAIIKRKWIMACIDAHKKLDVSVRGGKRIGYDVADSGEDLNAYIEMDGGLVDGLVSWKGAEDELYESSQKVYLRAKEIGAKVNYDSNGIGAGVGSNMKQMNNASDIEVMYYGFDSGDSPAFPDQKYKVDGVETQQTNREYFENRKAQAWWLLADRIKATYRAVTLEEEIEPDIIFSISGELDDLDKLITELSTPRKKMSGRLKNIVEKKDDLRKRGIASPNLADALVMASYPYMEEKVNTYTFNLEGI